MESLPEKVTLHPEIEKLIGPREDVEQFVNNVLFVYLSGGFIRKSDVAGAVVVNNIYRRSSVVGTAAFDTVAHEFKGIVLGNESQSQSLFISSGKLVDLLEENQVVMVLKSPRQKGISTVKGKDIVHPLQISDEITT